MPKRNDMRKFFVLLLSVVASAGFAQAETMADSAKVRLETSVGAEIAIDGDVSSTNIMSKKVAVGKHTVTVSYGSSYSKQYEIEVSRGGSNSFSFMLDGKVTITSQPQGSSVYVDGMFRGKTPLTLEMLGGHSVRVSNDEKVWFETTERLTVKPFEDITRDYVLRKRPPRLYGFVLGNYTGAGGGLTLGICRRFGLYSRLCFDGGQAGNYVEGGVVKEGTTAGGPIHLGAQKYMLFTGGVMARCTKFLYAYVGAGYGEYAKGVDYSFYYDSTWDGSNVWSNLPDSPFGSKGAVVDCGLILKWKALLLQGGFATVLGGGTPDPYRELYVGVGFTIHKNKKK